LEIRNSFPSGSAIAAVGSFFFSSLVFVVDGGEVLWTTHVESGLARQITQIVG